MKTQKQKKLFKTKTLKTKLQKLSEKHYDSLFCCHEKKNFHSNILRHEIIFLISGSALLPPHIASHTQTVPGDILLNFYLPLCSS